MASAQQKVEKLIDENAVMVFSKSYCPYCRSTKRTLEGLGAKFNVVELDLEGKFFILIIFIFSIPVPHTNPPAEDGSALQDALEKISGQRTVPNIYIGKQHIGGNSDLDARKNKDLVPLLTKVGAISA
ncbi:glutaredoxin domain containing protein [Niveomyces insectorum RCEF 264]|uniref:Glutaredoxin domain containing protein n=1 Tax=Niveomyces insectorum RCEF 264 TaxID=1081102 RepID=A0A167PDG0_9HYPO|nr:glutaredoxin domain containing protein [Niveomyces insectorum RCEF 264]